MRRPRVLDPAPTIEDLFELGTSNGLDAIGACSAQILERARRELHRRRDEGLSDGMKFTYKNPDRSTDPFRSVPGAATIIVGARRYNMPSPAEPVVPSGRVGRYAWVDHYVPLRDSLTLIKRRLRRSGFNATVFADDNSIVDREVAYLAGLGWFGKNANLLLPRAGSWFVIGCVVTNVPFDVSTTPMADGCGACRRCLDGCPTAAIVAPGVVDARRCLAWLLQRPGSFPIEFREALGDRIYGCDDCQEVCPPNQRFGDDRHHLDADLAHVTPWVDLVELLELDDVELMARHGRWYIHDREPRWVRRNALIALGNSADPSDSIARETVERYRGDGDPMLREHAEWAQRRMAARSRSISISVVHDH